MRFALMPAVRVGRGQTDLAALGTMTGSLPVSAMPNQGTVGIGEEHTMKSIRLLGMRWLSSVGYEPLFNDGSRERLVGTASADLVRRSHNFASGDRGREWCAEPVTEVARSPVDVG
jgi:hypothetical protein